MNEVHIINVRCRDCGNQWKDHTDFLPIGVEFPSAPTCTCIIPENGTPFWEIQQHDGTWL